MSNVVLNILSEFKGKKAFKDADTAVARLSKTVKGLGLAYAVSAAGAAAFAKASVNAFIADEAAASKLSNAVKNLGMEFANPYIAQYIGEMEKMTKVADDELRPAFQTLIQQTGSLAASQSALSTAIEVSRGSGIDLSTVANDLAQAYVGNTKGLRKYYLGLSTATLQAKSFTEIQQIMNNQFAGSSAAYLSTYSGQVGVLSLAWGNFQESVGGALLTMASFGSGGESKGLSNLATILDKIGAATTLISKGWDSVAKLFNLTGKGGLLSAFNPTGIPQGGSSGGGGKVPNPQDKYAAQLAKIEKERKAQNAAILKSQKALTAEQKKQAALKKASTLFDLEQANLLAALKKNLSEEDRKRAELQLALMTGNLSEAEKLTKEIAVAQGLGIHLANYLASLPDAKNPFESWKAYLDKLEAQAARIAAMPAGGGGGAPSTNVPNNNPFPDPSASQPEIDRERGNFYGSGNVGAQNVVVQIDGRTIAAALLDQSMSAGQVAYLNRRTGGFD